jgi:hypothetical protein
MIPTHVGSCDDDDMICISEFKYLGHLTSDNRNVGVQLEGDRWSCLGFKNAWSFTSAPL